MGAKKRNSPTKREKIKNRWVPESEITQRIEKKVKNRWIREEIRQGIRRKDKKVEKIKERNGAGRNKYRCTPNPTLNFIEKNLFIL